MSPRIESPPHVLRDYALLADGERGALVGPRGDLAWMCFPHWDSPGVFSTLIGGSGTYVITPAEANVWGGYYEPGTLIWHSRWVTPTARIESEDALVLPSRPGRTVILRRVRAIEGHAHVEVTLDPRADFGRAGMTRLRRADDGRWFARLGGLGLCWRGGQAARPRPDGHRGRALALTLDLPEGAHHDFVLVIDESPDLAEAPDPDRAWAGTRAGWTERVPDLPETLAPRDARHAYAVMSGLTGAGAGMVAAATTSLPERAQEGRDYDYRYVWIRDQCYAGQAVARAGGLPLMDDAVRFVRDRLLDDGPRLRPAYTGRGETIPPPRRLRLPGYPGGDDVVGNRVSDQFQLDAFGEALLLFAAAGAHDHLDAEAWQAVEIAAAAIERRWQESDTDAGLWELNPDAWTHGRLICAAGLRAISAHSPGREQPAAWLTLADQIVADTASRALHPDGCWQRSPGDARLDAALLMPAVRGAIPTDDPRTLATLQAVRDELTEDGYCYRYRPDERPLGASEGAFLLCGFWLSLALHQQGDRIGAARCFERNRAACGPPGLCSEEFDVSQRQLRGNLPQAFVHAVLLECAAAQAQDA